MARSSYSRERSKSRDNRDKKSKRIDKKDREEGREKRKIVLSRGNNWSKEQKNIEEIDEEELQKAQSSYIAPESNLGQSNILQNRQKKLFHELMPKNFNAESGAQPVEEPSSYHPSMLIAKRDSSTYYFKGHVAGVTNVLKDNTKIKRKIKIPTHTGFNYAGLIIGPKGANQKRMEEETGCKILVRGRGSQKEGQPPQEDDFEDLHVLIAGDTERQVQRAVIEVNKILQADEQTRNVIRQEQLKLVAQLKNKELGIAPYQGLDHMNYYGITNPNAYIVSVPSELISLVVGPEGKTIRRIKEISGVQNIQVAPDNNPNVNTRNIYIESGEDPFVRAKAMIEEVLQSHQKLKVTVSDDKAKNELEIQVNISIPLTALQAVVGRDMQNLMDIEDKHNVKLTMSKTQDYDSDQRNITCVGRTANIMAAKHDIDLIVAEASNGETSIITYQNDTINNNGNDTSTKASDDGNNGLFEGQLTEENGVIDVTDRGTDYYKSLKKYFGLGLDFLGEATDNMLTVTEYYPDGKIKVDKKQSLY